MRFRLFWLITLTCSYAFANPIETEPDNARQLYEEFKIRYNKVYGSEHENQYRFNVFKNNLLVAERLQAEEKGTAKYGVTPFSDLTEEEFRSFYLGVKLEAPIESNPVDEITIDFSNDGGFDWREKGAVGPVLNQGHCGSCWAFSVVGNIEGQWFRKTGKLLQLSEQQLVDCDTVDHGCDGGYPPDTYAQVKKMGGLETSKDYPYKARDMKCHMEKSKMAVYVNSSMVFPPNELVQMTALKNRGPLASALNAITLQHYRKGIIHPQRASCNPRNLNHGVLTVGYGTENGVPFWNVRNSWGTHFGENGYFRIFRGDGSCGINLLVSTAIIQ